MKHPLFPLLPLAVVTGQLLAQNQTDEAPAGMAQLEPVIVTGSTLRRDEAESSPAVVVLDRRAIERSGARTVNGVLGRLPQNTLGLNENVSNGLSFSPGAAGASLRGLGVTSTLVLLNGRRVAPFAFAAGGTDTFVDLNSIPLSAVERIEVLKEGASAIYGSEAIAGVINIILRSDYTGFETETYYGNTTRRDAGEFRQSFISGLDSGPLHLFLTGNYYHRNPLAAVDRSFSASADQRRRGGFDFRSEFANPGTILVGDDEFAVPRGSDGRPTQSDFLPGRLGEEKPYRNRDETNDAIELIAETERWGGLLTFRYEITPHLEVFGEASYQAVKSKTRVNPSPVDSEADEVVVPASNPFNPFGEEVGFLWRSVETGPRRNTVELDAYRYLVGLRVHDLPRHWTSEAAFLYSESNAVDHATHGFLSTAKIQAALDDPDPATALNVFGDGQDINDRETLRGLVIRPRTDGLAYLYSVDVKASGELFDLPAGPVRLGLGAEYREEFHRQRFSVAPGAVASYGSADSEGGRDVRSLFFEARFPLAGPGFELPLVRALDFTIAERFDHYSDFGQSTKPKLGLEWKPCEGLLLRGAYSEGFRAPSLPQLFSGVISGFTTVKDPLTGLNQQVAVRGGSNPDLQPELSYSYFLGGTIAPPFAPGLSVTLDFFHLEQRNLIGLPTAQEVVDGGPGRVERGENGRILRVHAPYANFGNAVIEGWDLELDYRIETRFGAFRLASSMAYISTFRQALVPGEPLEDRRDRFGFPEFKMVNSLFFSRGGFEAGITVNYVDSYGDDETNKSGQERDVGSWTTVDLQLSYAWPAASLDNPGRRAQSRWRWLDDAKLTVGCLNAGDSEPPFLNVPEGYDPQTADAAGRFLYASFRKKFW